MSDKKERKKLWLAVLASLCLHVVIALSLAAFSGSATPLPPEEDKPVELTMMDLSATPPPAKANPPYMETAPDKEAPEPPKEKTFESNANSIAASKLPASGDEPLPSQDGKERAFLDLQTQNSSLPVEGSRAVAPQPTPPPQQATPMPTTAPTATPKASATPVPTPVTTPAPASTPEPEKLAMLTSTPPPPLRDTSEVEATPPPQVGPTTPPDVTRPRPQTPASAYQPEKQATRITGRLTDKGPSAVNAVGTPLGKYQKQVTDAIGARWYYYMKEKMDLVKIGTAHLEAEVDDKGKIRNLRVLSNNANEAFANICLQSFQEAQIPPIPPDLIATLPAGRLPIEISFTTYANQ
jgi:hypothetical protein